MKGTTLVVVLLALVSVTAGYLITHRYTYYTSGNSMYQIDNWTGKTFAVDSLNGRQELKTFTLEDDRQQESEKREIEKRKEINKLLGYRVDDLGNPLCKSDGNTPADETDTLTYACK